MVYPDYLRENYRDGCEIEPGGYDDEDRSMRYMEWHFDPDPTDTHYEVHFAIMLRRGKSAEVEVIHDHHRFGLFARATWLRLLEDAGFEPTIINDEQILIGHKRIQ
jgi:hypothetical protein